MPKKEDLISPLPHVGTSIFTTMSQLAREEDALNLSQGFPDFEVPVALADMVKHYIDKGFNQYAPSDGLPQLRQEISVVFGETYSKAIDPLNEVTITSGATEAIMASVSALVSTGDEVIIFDPSYDSYDPVVRLNGGIPIHLSLSQRDYGVDWEMVEKAINKHTRVIIINTPHNPTGATWSAPDMEKLRDIVVKNDLFVISDEVYHHIVFDHLSHESILKYPEIARRGVAVFSFGKIVHATGWKMGFAVAPEYITREIRKVHQFLTFSVHTPTQYALADYLGDGIDFASLGKLFQQKRDVFLRHITTPHFKSIPSRGTYFQLLSFDFKMKDTELAERMTRDFKLASIPVSVFNADGRDDRVLRFCFAKEDATLIKAAAILNSVSYE